MLNEYVTKKTNMSSVLKNVDETLKLKRWIDFIFFCQLLILLHLLLSQEFKDIFKHLLPVDAEIVNIELRFENQSSSVSILFNNLSWRDYEKGKLLVVNGRKYSIPPGDPFHTQVTKTTVTNQEKIKL